MQKDFHFYTIYTLCRCAGMQHDAAYKISYSSQFVDDAKYGHILEFKKGGFYKQTRTAAPFCTNVGELLKKDEAIKDLVNFVSDSEIQNQIYVPFHFLPGGEPANAQQFREKMICRPNSKIANELVDFIINEEMPNTLYTLGISLHVYADTWSHQNFSAQFTGLDDNNLINDIQEAYYSNGEKCSPIEIPSSVGSFLKNPSGYLKVGHASVGSAPDEPHKNWEYFHSYWNKKILQNNSSIYTDASKHIYLKLLNYRETKHGGEFFNSPSQEWISIEKTLTSCFKDFIGNEEERCQSWHDALVKGILGFNSVDLSYHHRDWFYKAVNVTPIEEKEDNWKTWLLDKVVKYCEVTPRRKPTDIYHRLEGFESSDWKLFNDSAAYLQFYILRELLPKYEIYCA